MKQACKTYLPLSAFLLTALLITVEGCDVLDEILSTPKKPDEVLVNPVDPQSPVYLKPVTTIITKPSATAPLAVAQTTIIVQGNKDAVAFSYKLDNRGWSAWDPATSVVLTDLDEGRRTFTVRALHRDRVTIEQNPPSISFTVNAVKGPAIMFVSRRKEVKFGEQFLYYIVAEEIQNVYGAKIVFTYDNARVLINSIAAGNTVNSIAANAQIFSMQYNNSVRIEMFFTGNKPVNGISGSDTIATLNCTAFGLGQADFVFITDSVKYRNPNNVDIAINQIVNGKVVVR